jgi:hypothetical protein
MLAEALNLIEQAAKAEAAALETAVAALGESHARTVVDLARMPVAAEISRVLLAIRSAADAMLAGTSPAIPTSPAPAPSASAASDPVQRAVTVPQPDASGRIELYGISVPASRHEEAEEVVAAARTAVAQNRKANPYDHYRGKNSWCKSLFLAAFSNISTEASQRMQAEASVSGESLAPAAAPHAEPSPAPEREVQPVVPPRPSIAGSGPLRAARQVPAEHAPQPAAPRNIAPSPSRLHAHGITAQTIEDPGKSREPPPQTAKPTTRSFFKQRTR